MTGVRRALGVALACLAIAGGCGSNPNNQLVLKRPPEPPAVPPPQPVPLDSQMRSLAIRQIGEARQSQDASVRAQAIEATARTMGSADAGAIIAAMDDPSPAVRFAAAMAAGQAGIRQARPKLMALLSDPDMRVRPGAIFALHKTGDPRFSRQLEQLARHDDPAVRGNVAFVLGLIGEPSAVKPLRGMQADVSPLVRIQAAESLWAYGDERGKQTLLGYSISRFADDQMDAIWALSASDADVRVLPLLRGKLTDDYPEIALTAARSLGRLGRDDGYAVAVEYARAREPLRRMLAALALGQIGRADAQPYLRPLLSDPDARVRLAAATAVLQLHG